MQYEELRVGQWATMARTITVTEIVMFAGLTGDSNPSHLNDEWASRTRFGKRIAHGMLTAGILAAVLGTKLPGDGAIYVSQSLRFSAPVFPGDTITARAEVIELITERRRVRLATTCINQHGQVVLEGEAVMLVDNLPPASLGSGDLT